MNLAYGFYGIVRAFNWRTVGIITQDENLFTVVSISLTTVCMTQSARHKYLYFLQTMNRLQELLRQFPNISVVERRFDTGDGIDGLGDDPFVCCYNNNS